MGEIERNPGDITEEWDLVIKPQKGLLEVNLKEVWEYRDLFTLFVKRDIITQYKQTVLGPIWFFVQPALTTLIYMVIFGGIAGISTDGLPQPLFYLAGIVFWQYFADCLNKTSSTFTANQAIFGKVYFPRLIVPIATISANLLRLGIQALLFFMVYLFYVFALNIDVRPNATILITPFLIIILAGLSLGFGVIISSLTTKYRDLTILFTFVVQLWMYATPVIYPLSTMSPKMQHLMSLNPVTPILEAFKYGTLGSGTFSWSSILYSLVFMIGLNLVGILVFNKVQRSFMDTV